MMTEMQQLEMLGLPAPVPKKEPRPPKSRVVSLRLPMSIVNTLERRIAGRKSRWQTIGEYLKERVIYDVERKHGGKK